MRGRCDDVAKDIDTRHHLVWTVRNRDPMQEESIRHGIPLAREQQGWTKT